MDNEDMKTLQKLTEDNPAKINNFPMDRKLAENDDLCIDQYSCDRRDGSFNHKDTLTKQKKVIEEK